MDHLTAALLIPTAIAVMLGLSEIARAFTRSRRRPDVGALEAQMDALEHELESVRRELSETQERLDFTERLLTQTQERKRLGAAE